MQTLRILLNVGPHGLAEPVRRLLREACGDATVTETTEATSLDRFDGRQTDVLVTEDIPRNLSAWPRLRFVQLFSAGSNHLANHPVWSSDIAVANSSGTHGVPIAQYVTCAVLMLAHRMPQLIEVKRSRQWRPEGLDAAVVRGQTLGILGYGSIGRECARQLNALGMRIVCLKRDPARRHDDGFNAWPGTGDPEGKIPERWFGPDQLREMLPLCDVLVVAAAATPATLGLVGTTALALLKSGAHLIIVSRGGIVEEKALAEALRSGHLGGAAVDCFVQEPLPRDHVFFETPNLILTPHMSGVHQDFWPTMAALLRENLRRSRAGEPVLNRTDGRLGY